jgi:hypothetical protein
LDFDVKRRMGVGRQKKRAERKGQRERWRKKVDRMIRYGVAWAMRRGYDSCPS